MKVKSESEVAQSYLTLSNPMDCSPQAPPSMGFSRQEYWSGVPLPTGAQKTMVSVVQHRGISVGSGHSAGNSAQYYLTT